MEHYEKLGVFYLGRHYDLERKQTTDEPLLYDSRDLTTHAVCVGMTGSGKTGLCVALLEEAAIDGIPALVIDPKGDLGNLLLTFPDLRAEDFEPWVDPEEARRRGLDPAAYAAGEARSWREGLAAWSQDGERIRRLRAAADFAIYTPGSEAGLPVSILGSFDVPPEAVRADADLLRERIASTAGSLLGLVGLETDPLRSREQILLCTILDESWKQGRSLDLAGLIRAIQSPPVERVGVLELETFFPARERFELALTLNNLLAAPGFQGWLAGEPLNVQQLLYTAEGRPRIAVFSIAHLTDRERMFFVALLTGQLLGWTRTRPGTTSLRALLYMDEVFGFMPPSAEPPSKRPLLTLLKQARAFGVGIVLATQNPVDLDYKGLANAGTWFLGRLQTERDKLRVLEGLEGLAAGGARFDRQQMDRLLSGLGQRVFLMHNVHEEQPVLFQSRWALSYLRGPLTREQIRRLMDTRRSAVAARGPAPAPAAAKTTVGPRPLLEPDIAQLFLPARQASEKAAALLYEPRLLGFARVQYVDPRTKKLRHAEELTLAAPLGSESDGTGWEQAELLALSREEFLSAPQAEAGFGTLPPRATKAASYAKWRSALADDLARTRTLELRRSPGLGLEAEPGESEGEFRARLADAARERRDRLAGELRQKYAGRVVALEERIRRADTAVERESAQATGQKLQTAISLGATLLSAVLGRRTLSAGTLGRATTAARGFGRAAKEQQDVGRAVESREVLRAQLAEINGELEQELARMETRIDPRTEQLETTVLRPRKGDIVVRLVALGWIAR